MSNQPEQQPVDEPELTGPVYLILDPMPDDVPAGVRLKRALKCLLRGFRLRCTHVGYRLPEPPKAEKPRRKKVTGATS